MAQQDHPFVDPAIRAAFEVFDPAVRDRLLMLRALIFDAGDARESLKWGQPSYETGKAGTPIRLGVGPSDLSYGFYVHCQTDLIAQYQTHYGDALRYSGTRGVYFDVEAPVPAETLVHCFQLALTYHERKRENHG